MQKNQKIIICLLVSIVTLLAVGIFLLVNQNKNIVPLATQINDTASKNIALDASNPSMKEYSALFNAEFAKDANYENFRIVSIPCKDIECTTVYALNKNTGKIYLLGEEISGYTIKGNEIGIDYMSGIGAMIYYDQMTDSFKAQPSDNHYGI
jgi:hypothetical protein